MIMPVIERTAVGQSLWRRTSRDAGISINCGHPLEGRLKETCGCKPTGLWESACNVAKRSQWKLVRMTVGIQKNHLVNLAKRSQRKLVRMPVRICKNGEIFLPFYRLKKGGEKAKLNSIVYILLKLGMALDSGIANIWGITLKRTSFTLNFSL